MASSAEKWMAEAAELAREGMQSHAGGPFGAIIVQDGQCIGRGHNCVLRDNDPTAHAEVMAIRAACGRTGQVHLPGATLYTSCEPCPMCLAAIYWARIPEVVFANTREDADRIGFADCEFYQQIALPLEKQSIRFIHHPHTDAAATFEEWEKWEVKGHY